MNKYEQDEMRHWRKECYRTLHDAEQVSPQPTDKMPWGYVIADDTFVFATLLGFIALALGLFCLSV